MAQRPAQSRARVLVRVTNIVIWAVLMTEHAKAVEQPLLLPPGRAEKLPSRSRWKAEGLGRGSAYDFTTLADGVKMMGTARAIAPLGIAVAQGNSSSLPHEYDVRDAWWKCSAVSRVMNQGPCGSCYAVFRSRKLLLR